MLQPSSKVLIAGCGYVGIELARVLGDLGVDVWGLRRNTDSLPDGLKTISADLCDRDSLEAIPLDIDVVVYAASAGEYSEEAYERAYVTGVGTLLDLFQARGQELERFVFVSSTGVYGQKDGEEVDEESETLPASFSGAKVLAGEALALGRCASAVVLRLGGIYGPGRTRFIEAALAGKIPIDDELPVYTNRIHREDCARAISHILGLENPKRIYVGVDSAPAPRHEVVDWLIRESGVDVEVQGTEGVFSRRRSGSKRCSNRALLDSGYTFLYPTYKEGYREILKEVIV